MKLKEGFILRQVADNWIVVPVGNAVAEFQGMINLNETGATLWRALEQGADRNGLVDALTTEYAVDREVAAVDVDMFLNKLIQADCVISV